MTAEPLKEAASVRLWQCGEYVEDGVVHRIGPVVSQAFIDAEGRWTQGAYNALDPSRSLAIEGTSEAEVASMVAHFRLLAAVSGSQ